MLVSHILFESLLWPALLRCNCVNLRCAVEDLCWGGGASLWQVVILLWPGMCVLVVSSNVSLISGKLIVV